MRLPVRSRRGVLPLAVCVSACSTFGWQRFQDPTIELDTIVVRDLTVSGGILEVVVLVRNPNGYAIRGDKLEIGLDVAGSRVGDILYERRFDLPKHGASRLTLPLSFRWTGVGAAARSALTQGRISYDLSGHVRVRTAGGDRVVPFARVGDVDLSLPSRRAEVGARAGAGEKAPTVEAGH